MSETIALIVGLVLAFVAAVIAARHIITENQNLKAENRTLTDRNRKLRGWYLALKRQNINLKWELAWDEDAAEQERETP